MANSARPEGQKMGVSAYLASWVDKAAQMVGTAPPEPSAQLAFVLPPAPKGWKRAETAPDDVADLLVPAARAVVGSGGGEPGEDVRRLASVGRGPYPENATMAAFTYSYGKDRIVIELLRHPDALFLGTAQIPERMALQTWVLDNGAEQLGIAHGMPVWQARLAPGLGARMAIASVGGQIQLRAAYAERVKPAAVMALLAQMNVAALNATVVAPDAAITAATAPAPEPAANAGSGAGFMGAVTGMLFGKATGPETKADRKSREDELVAAAKSGNGAKAAALAALQYGAVAEELGKTEMKAAPGATGAASAARRGRQTEIDIGIGSCGDRCGGKFCSVGGAKN
jgi:hypothetical protein